MRYDATHSPREAAAWWKAQARHDFATHSGHSTPETEYLRAGHMVIVEHDSRRMDCRGTPVRQWYRQGGFPA